MRLEILEQAGSIRRIIQTDVEHIIPIAKVLKILFRI